MARSMPVSAAEEAPRCTLRAGPLTVELDTRSGLLRYVRLGEREILRGIYAAVRDANWGTVPPELSNLAIASGGEDFEVSFRARCREGEIDFAWNGEVLGTADGTIRYRMEGEACSTFRRNRIGFCVLHPLDGCLGKACRVRRSDGSVEEGRFPEHVSPDQPFLGFQSIEHEIAPGLSLLVALEGETFEMEDQRNWTDASFKTYGTPLALPYPVEVPKGTKISQRVTLSLVGALDERRRPPSSGAAAIEVRLAPAVPLPKLGLGTASHKEPLSEREIERLERLHLDHLRVDLPLGNGHGGDLLSRVATEAQRLGARLHGALLLENSWEENLARLAGEVERTGPPVSVWLLSGPPADGDWMAAVAVIGQRLATWCRGSRIAVGTDANFAELNRSRPPAGVGDFLWYSANPQVHAFDNDSLIESLEGQFYTVETARQFAAGRPVVVSPVTLKPRRNAVATGPEPAVCRGGLPPQVDIRQPHLFAAGWTLGSIAALARGGAASVTYFETTGWRGVMETERGAAREPAFPSTPGSVYPVYHVLADMGEIADCKVRPVAASHPLAVQGLATNLEGAVRIWLANLTGQPRSVVLSDFQSERFQSRVRTLDESSLAEAAERPEDFRRRAGTWRFGEPRLELPPYAVTRIDCRNGGNGS